MNFYGNLKLDLIGYRKHDVVSIKVSHGSRCNDQHYGVLMFRNTRDI